MSIKDIYPKICKCAELKFQVQYRPYFWQSTAKGLKDMKVIYSDEMDIWNTGRHQEIF